MLRIFGVVAILLCEVGCSEVYYAPPPQRVFVPHSVHAVFQGVADQPDPQWVTANKDVLGPVAHVGWRWLRAHPEFRFQLLDYSGWHLAARLTGVATVIDAKGPQRVVFSVNGTPVGKALIDKPVSFDFFFQVPAAVMQAASPVVLRLDLDPCLAGETGAEKGLAYCALLQSIGFVRDAE